MNQKIKYIIIAIIGFVAFTSIILYSLGIINLSLIDSSSNTEEVKQINLFVDYNNGTQKEKLNFTLTDGNISAFDALNFWCQVVYIDYGTMGILVTSIDGISGDWVYSVNGTQPSVSSTKVFLKNNSNVSWWRLTS